MKLSDRHFKENIFLSKNNEDRKTMEHGAQSKTTQH